MIASLDIFRDSEAAHPIREEEYIKVERIKGKLLLIGAKDDVLWDTVKYIRRMEARLAARAYLRGGKRYLRACHTFRVPGGNGEDHAARRRRPDYKSVCRGKKISEGVQGGACGY